nr:unnamed protein product [Naegleria fowleri]
MSNLKEKIAAFENRSLMASQPPPHHHKEQVIHSSQHQQPPQTNSSGGLNVPPSAVGHGTPSPSTPSVATNINHHHTTTPTISAKTPMSSHHSNGKQLPPTPTDRSSLNIGLSRNINPPPPPNTTPRSATIMTSPPPPPQQPNNSSSNSHHPITPMESSPPQNGKSEQNDQDDSTSSNEDEDIINNNNNGSMNGGNGGEEEPESISDNNQQQHPQQQNTTTLSQQKVHSTDLHQLPKNKPAVPNRFRNNGGGTVASSSGTSSAQFRPKPNPKLPPSLPQPRRAQASVDFGSSRINIGGATGSPLSESTTNNLSGNNLTGGNLVTNLDPNSAISYSDSASASRISMRAGNSGMVYASGLSSLPGDKGPQGKFIPYIPAEVEAVMSVTTGSAGVHAHTISRTSMSISSIDLDSETQQFAAIYKHPTKQQQDAAIVLQKYIRRWEARKTYKKIQKARVNRENCAKEILSTEKSYVESLNILQEVYLKPFKAMAAKEKPIISKEEVQAIFSDIDVILNVNTTFLNDLEERLKTYEHNVQISDIFLTIAPFFKTYSRYCNNFDKANEVLKECKKREDFKEVVVKMDKDSRTSKLGLQSYLILPIQRIPRYRLLLQDLIKHSGPDHPDYKGLKNALDKICEVADHLNNTMKIIEATNDIIKIQSQFYGDINLVEPHRRFLKEGALQEIISSDFTKTRDTYIHLFNDIVLFSQKGGKFTLKVQFPLNDLVIFNYVNQDDQIDDLIFKVQSPSKAIILKAASKSDKDNWAITLHNLIKECKNSKRNKTLNVDEHTIADDSSTTFALAMSDNDEITIPPEECVRRMKEGSTMLKYCRNAKPHFRRFVLSNDGTELMWGSPNKQSNESIVSLTDVKKICYGQNTAIFQKYKNPDLEGLSFSLLYRDRTLDSVCKDKQEYHTWDQGVTYLLSHMEDILNQKRIAPPTASNEPKFAPPALVHDMENEKQKFKEQFERIGDAYTWGQGACGGLGHGNQEDKKEPLVMKDFLYLDVSLVACENSAGAGVMFTGELFTWGKGEKGRLGHSDTNDRIKPTYVKALQGRNIKHVCMGNLHTLCLDDTGTVFAFGDYQYGQCGLEKVDGFTSTPTPLPICTNGFKVTTIACGHWHSAIVSNDGQLLTFGRGEDGQLGFGDKSNRATPTRVKGVLDDYKIVDVACGLWHTMALTEEGYLFTWGNNTYGQCGHNNTDEYLLPAFVETFRNMPVKQIAAGSAHSGCITEGDGAVYMWGNGIYGQIGNNSNTHALSPMRVKFGKLKAKQLVCGVNHAMTLMEDGSVYAWGAGTYGRLGINSEGDQRVPVRITFFDDKSVRTLGAGGSQSAAVCAHQWVPDKDATNCMNESCKAKFTFLRRRHHCRYCGGIFCGNCTTKRITLLRFGFDEPVRVCDNCYQILTNAAQTYKR